MPGFLIRAEFRRENPPKKQKNAKKYLVARFLVGFALYNSQPPPGVQKGREDRKFRVKSGLAISGETAVDGR